MLKNFQLLKRHSLISKSHLNSFNKGYPIKLNNSFNRLNHLNYSTSSSASSSNGRAFKFGKSGLVLLGTTTLLGSYLIASDFKNISEVIKPIRFTDKASYIEHPDASIAFENKSLYELCISLFVYKLCNIPFLMDMTPTILSLLETFHIAGPAYFFIKKTIFSHFCGGEDREDVVPFMQTLAQSGVGSILDFSIEADLPEHSDLPLEQIRANANQHADFVCEQYRQAVITASNLKGSFIAVKVTGLVNPTLLEKATSILHFLRGEFIKLDFDKDGLISKDQFKTLLMKLPGSNEQLVKDVIKRADPKNTNQIDWISYLGALSMVKPESHSLYLGKDSSVTSETQHTRFDVDFFSPEESEDLFLLVKRLNIISNEAAQRGVRLMIDAEQSYFQAAIDLVANDLSVRYNLNQPIIFNTYQLYLKESYDKMKNDLIHSKRDGWYFGAKLVRGAYMISERKRAQELGMEDIIQDTIEDTHRDYNLGVELLLNEMASQQSNSNEPHLAFMVASHNAYSITQTCRLMEQLNIPLNTNNVMFGQLMGMQDATTYTLAKHGFKAYKYIPYGPVKEVMPYLIRRAQENSGMLDGVSKEMNALKVEIKNRLFGTKVNVEVETP